MEVLEQSPPAAISFDNTQEVFRVASDLFSHGPDWVTFFREVLGIEGVVRKVFRTPDELLAFEITPEFAEIQEMLAKLREKSSGDDEGREPTRVITIRMPKSLHESLRQEAHRLRTSMNKLCLSKLLQVVPDQLVPIDREVK